MAALHSSGIREQIRFDRLPLRLALMMLGLTGFGASLGLILRAGLGADPWNVFGVAVADRLGVTPGTVIVVTSFLILVLWIPLRERIGIATIANSLWVGVSCDLALAVTPQVTLLPAQIALLVGSVVLCAVSDAVYIGAQLGTGPRDGLMTGLHRRTGWPIGPVRMGIELVVLAVGWALGGPLGIGTFVFALCLGPIVHLVLPRVILPVLARDRTVPTPAA